MIGLKNSTHCALRPATTRCYLKTIECAYSMRTSLPATPCLCTRIGGRGLFIFCDFVRRDAAGLVLVDSRKLPRPTEGIALWTEPLAPHTLENVGDTDLHVISVEVKSAK